MSTGTFEDRLGGEVSELERIAGGIDAFPPPPDRLPVIRRLAAIINKTRPGAGPWVVERLETREPGMAGRLGVYATGKGRVGVYSGEMAEDYDTDELTAYEQAASYAAGQITADAFSQDIDPDKRAWTYAGPTYRRLRSKNRAVTAGNSDVSTSSRVGALLATPYLRSTVIDIASFNDSDNGTDVKRGVSGTHDILLTIASHLPPQEHTTEDTPDELPGRQASGYRLRAITHDGRVYPLLEYSHEPALDFVTEVVPMKFGDATHGVIRRLQIQQTDFHLLDEGDRDALAYLVDGDDWKQAHDGIEVDGDYARELLGGMEYPTIHVASVLKAHQSWLAEAPRG